MFTPSRHFDLLCCVCVCEKHWNLFPPWCFSSPTYLLLTTLTFLIWCWTMVSCPWESNLTSYKFSSLFLPVMIIYFLFTMVHLFITFFIVVPLHTCSAECKLCHSSSSSWLLSVMCVICSARSVTLMITAFFSDVDALHKCQLTHGPES